MKRILHRTTNLQHHRRHGWLIPVAAIVILITALVNTASAQQTAEVKTQAEFQQVFSDIADGEYAQDGIIIEVMADIDFNNLKQNDASDKAFLYLNTNNGTNITINGNSHILSAVSNADKNTSLMNFVNNGSETIKIQDLLFNGNGICANMLKTSVNIQVQRCHFYEYTCHGIKITNDIEFVIENSIFAEYVRLNPTPQNYNPSGIAVANCGNKDVSIKGCSFSNSGNYGIYASASSNIKLFASVFEKLRFGINQGSSFVSQGYNCFNYTQALAENGTLSLNGNTDQSKQTGDPLLWNNTYFPDPHKLPLMDANALSNFTNSMDFVQSNRNPNEQIYYPGAISSPISDFREVTYDMPGVTKEYDGTQPVNTEFSIPITNPWPNIPAKINVNGVRFDYPPTVTQKGWQAKLTLDMKNGKPYKLPYLPYNNGSFNNGIITPRHCEFNDLPYPSKKFDGTEDFDFTAATGLTHLKITNIVGNDDVRARVIECKFQQVFSCTDLQWLCRLELEGKDKDNYQVEWYYRFCCTGSITMWDMPDTIYVHNQEELQYVFTGITSNSEFNELIVVVEVMNDIVIDREMVTGLSDYVVPDFVHATFNGNGHTISSEKDGMCLMNIWMNGDSRMTISDLNFNGMGKCNTGLTSQIRRSANFSIRRCHFYGFTGIGMCIGESANIIESCIFSDSDKGIVFGNKEPNSVYIGNTSIAGCTFSNLKTAGIYSDHFTTMNKYINLSSSIFQNTKYCIYLINLPAKIKLTSLGYNYFHSTDGTSLNNSFEPMPTLNDIEARSNNNRLPLLPGTFFPDAAANIHSLSAEAISYFTDNSDYNGLTRDAGQNKWIGAISGTLTAEYSIPDHTKLYDGTTAMTITDSIPITNALKNRPASIVLTEAAYSDSKAGTENWSAKISLNSKPAYPYILSGLDANGRKTFTNGLITPLPVHYNSPSPSKFFDCTTQLENDTLEVTNRITGDPVKIVLSDAKFEDAAIKTNKKWKAHLSLINNPDGNYDVGIADIEATTGTIKKPEKIYVHFTCKPFACNGKPDVLEIDNVTVTPSCIDTADLNLKVTSTSANVGTWDVKITAQPKSPYSGCKVELAPDQDTPKVTITPIPVVYTAPSPSKIHDCTTQIENDTLEVTNRIIGDPVKIVLSDGQFEDAAINTNKKWKARLSLINNHAGNYTVDTDEIAATTGTVIKPEKIYVHFTCKPFIYNGKPDVLEIDNVTVTPSCIDTADLNLKVTSKSAEAGTWEVTVSANPKSPYNGCKVILDPERDVPEVTIIDLCTLKVGFTCDTMEYSGENKVKLDNITIDDNSIDPSDLGLTAVAESSAVGTWEVKLSFNPVGSAKDCIISIDSSMFTDGIPTVTIVPRKITADLVPVSRSYDGTNEVALKYKKLSNTISGEKVSIKPATLIGLMDDKHAGEDKPLNLDGITLEGKNAANYTLISNEVLTVDITPAELSVTAKIKNKRNTVTYGEDLKLSYTTTPSTLFDKDKLTGDAEIDGKLSPDGFPVPGTHNLLVGTLAVDDGNEGKNYNLSFEDISFDVVFNCKADSDGDGINDCDDLDPFDPEVGGSEVSNVSNSQRNRDNKSNLWQILCPATGKPAPLKVTVTVSAPSNATVMLDDSVIKESSPMEYNVSIDVPKPGLYKKTIVVQYANGTEDTHDITIEQPLNPADVIVQKFDNLLILDNLSLKSYGINPSSYQWSCNGETIPGATMQGYSAGDKHGDLLNPDAEYTVEITLTKNAGKIHTCPYYPVLHLNSSRLKAWPNPVGRHEVINLEINSTGDAKSATSTQSTKSTKTAQRSANTKTLRIYNTKGEEIKQISIVEGINKLELGLKRGVYILKIDEEEIRVMVR